MSGHHRKNVSDPKLKARMDRQRSGTIWWNIFSAGCCTSLSG